MIKGDRDRFVVDAGDAAGVRQAAVSRAVRGGGIAVRGGAAGVSEVTLRSARAKAARWHPLGDIPRPWPGLSTQGST
ncbi:hypothetical protein HOK021_25310 [Streptomyces hygroscopicus]|nr:hypothetical protein HOK021_25310 [Streptomyces hygroscopicus]